MIIKNVKKPEDIFICGFDLRNVNQTFSTTDDEDMIRVVGRSKKYIEICGHVLILTKSELLSYMDELRESLEEDTTMETILVKDFSGNILLTVEDSTDGKDYLDPEYKGIHDTKDIYCRYRLIEGDGDEDPDEVVVNVGDFEISEPMSIVEVVKYLI